MDVAVEFFPHPQGSGHPDQALHGFIGATQDAGGEECAFYVVPPVEIHDEFDQFLRLETCAPDIVGPAVGAIGAIVGTGVGEKDLEEGDAAAVG
ncbi:MAG: hypothetical protein FD137_476 [Spirochaetes bacterium]|nr:MAG: hypothetical protein FD137_476 [Spirochaetota bacterium]